MITKDNFFQTAKEINPKTLPASLKEGFEFVREVTENHTTWKYYNADADIKATVDQYLANLSAYWDTAKRSDGASSNRDDQKSAREIAKNFIRAYVLRGDSVTQLNQSHLGTANGEFSAEIRSNKIHIERIGKKKVSVYFPLKEIYDEVRAERSPSSKAPKLQPVKGNTKVKPSTKQEPQVAKKRDEDPASPVERIDEAVRFIKRVVLMNGKTKTIDQIRNYLNSLQKAIIEKRIRKTSPYAAQIEEIQEAVVRLYNNMKEPAPITLSKAKLEELQAIANSEKVRLSVSYMKRYISLQGKKIDKEKAKKLHQLIGTAVNARKIAASDPYMKKIKLVQSSLKTFIAFAKKNDTLHIHDAVLNGIHEALDGCDCVECGDSLEGCGCQSLNGPEQKPTIMNSVDFASLQFDTLGFTGKWLDLIGDPSRNFTAMVFGLPKMGKSYLCIDFAGYLARHHGKVLYVAKEEGLDYTLQQKLNDKNVKHSNLDVSSVLPGDLNKYDFIFLDSVTKLGLSADDLTRLKAMYPSKSFIFIFQATKNGKFRGENTFQHDVDVVIEVPERGKAVQMGRFNQGGEINIFDDYSVAA